MSPLCAWCPTCRHWRLTVPPRKGTPARVVRTHGPVQARCEGSGRRVADFEKLRDLDTTAPVKAAG